MQKTIENTELVWVDQPQKLEKIATELAAEEILAVDTESNSLYAYQEQVCLLQFSTRKRDYLVDAIALRDLSVLGPIFSSPKILKVFHAAEYDLICLFRDYGFRFNYLFDTMIAARTLGYPAIGLAALLEKFFNIRMNKKYQRANWGRRPLKPDMLHYARLDSHYLIPLQGHLREELENSGRWKLALEDFRRLTQNIEDTTESSEADFWRIRGARDLSPESAAILKALYDFRESRAEAQDRPPFKVISQRALLEIAETQPGNRQALNNLPSLSRKLARRYGDGLLRAIRSGRQAQPEYPPHTKRPPDDVLVRIDALREWRKLTGRDLGVPSDVVMPRDVLNRIAWADPHDMRALQGEMQDVPYRFDRFGCQILSILNNGGSPS
jgi:ribonuclease D